MEGWVRDLRGWGRSSPSGEALPWVEGGGLLLTHSGAMTGMCWVQAAGGLLPGFPMGYRATLPPLGSLDQGAH